MFDDTDMTAVFLSTTSNIAREMKATAISPAGHQPVRIASYMEAGAKRPAKFLAKYRNALLTAIGAACSIVAYVSGIAFSVSESSAAWMIMSVSAITAIFTLYPIFIPKK